MSSCIYFNLYYLTRNTKHPSLWEGSGIEATPEQQKEIPPITAEETATGASEGQVVETIYAAISVDTQLLLGPTPQPTPAPVEQTGTSATTQSGGAQTTTTQAATNTQAAATQAAATQPAQTTQAATQAAATQAATTQAAATTGATEAQTTTTAGKYFKFVIYKSAYFFLLSYLYLMMGSHTYDSSPHDNKKPRHSHDDNYYHNYHNNRHNYRSNHNHSPRVRVRDYYYSIRRYP